MPNSGHIPQTGDILGGKYQVESTLGQGGMGVVLAARNLRTNRRVAIKWLLPWLMHNEVALKRFEREAQVAGGIVHPNVVSVYDVERDGETTYIVMELLEGRSLASHLSERSALALDEAMAIFMPILRGVAAAHAAGVVHRDLKPDNVFLYKPADGSPEAPKVLDFGISKITEREAGQQTTLTQDGAVIGTIQYMSPEQLRGKPTDRRTDVYALGVILYRMLAGQPPFQGENHIDLALNIAGNRPPPLSSRVSGLPEQLDAVLDRALARDVEQRIPDIETFARLLQPFCGGQQALGSAKSALPIDPLAPAPQGRTFETTPFVMDDRDVPTLQTRRASPWPAIAVIVVLAAGGLWLWAPWSAGPDAAQPPTHASPAPKEPVEPLAPPQAAPAAPASAPTAAPSTEGWVLTTEPVPAPQPKPAAAEPVAAPRAVPAPAERPSHRKVERTPRARPARAADKPPAPDPPDPPATPSFDELLPERTAPRRAPKPSQDDEAWKNL